MLGRGPSPTTHSARKPGRRSQGRNGRRPWRAHRCRCCGKSTPGGRRLRSAQRGRLQRAGRSAPGCGSAGGTSDGPSGTSLTQVTREPTLQPTWRRGPPGRPGHSPSSQCGPVQPRPQEQLPLAAWHRPPFLQEHTCSQLMPNRFWGQPGDRSQGLLGALAQGWSHSGTRPHLTFIQQTLPATSWGWSLPSGRTYAREQHPPSPFVHLSAGRGQAWLRAEAKSGGGARALQGLRELAQPTGGVREAFLEVAAPCPGSSSELRGGQAA